MPRLARSVVPGLPHHVTQRGNRRQQTFFCDDDYTAYLELMSEWCAERGVEVWAYCLMPNHIHLVAVPQSEDGLARAIGEAHRRYTRRINFREKWRGYLWQGRFASFVMDEPYLLAAARYVELNPVRAGLVGDAADWRWSSAGPHLSRRDDGLVRVGPMLAMVADWRALLDSAFAEDELRDLRAHSRSGCPLGDEMFVDRLERTAGRVLRAQKAGRPPKLLKRP
ncbi:MAG: transposase [Thermoguttaceae bacterium]